MSDMTAPLRIRAGTSPADPRSMRFVLDRDVQNGAVATFADVASAQGAPLAQALFAIAGVIPSKVCSREQFALEQNLHLQRIADFAFERILQRNYFECEIQRSARIARIVGADLKDGLGGFRVLLLGAFAQRSFFRPQPVDVEQAILDQVVVELLGAHGEYFGFCLNADRVDSGLRRLKLEQSRRFILTRRIDLEQFR